MMPRPPGGGDNASKAAQSKWDAWKSQEGLTKQQAKLEYVRCLLETMRALRPKEMKETPRAWVELEKAYQEASLSASANNSADASTNATANTSNNSFGGGNQYGGTSYPTHAGPIRGGPRGHSRRLSNTSSASTYSHFLRAKPQSTYSEFGLSEKDRNEIEADQLVDQLQSVYPPILPGAVVPHNIPSRNVSSPHAPSSTLGSPVVPGGVVPGGVDPAALSSNSARLGKGYNRMHRVPIPMSNAATAATSVNSSHLPTPAPPTPDSFGNPSDEPHKFKALEMVSALFKYVRQHISSGFNRLLYSITLDVVKLLSVLSIIRLIASRPEWLSRLPISQRILSTLGKLIQVILDEIGVEITIKTPRNVRRS